MAKITFVCVGNAVRSQLELHTGRVDCHDVVDWTRGFAVAAALLIAACLSTAATLPAIAFGIVEMTTSVELVKWFSCPL